MLDLLLNRIERSLNSGKFCCYECNLVALLHFFSSSGRVFNELNGFSCCFKLRIGLVHS